MVVKDPHRFRGPFPPLEMGTQAAEWIRNVQLARRHFDAWSTFQSRGIEIGMDGALAAYAGFASDSHRNCAMIHLAAALDRSGGAVRLADLVAAEDRGAAQTLAESDTSAAVAFVRNNTIGHRSRSHTNWTAWKRAALTADELRSQIETLETFVSGIRERHALSVSEYAPAAVDGLDRLISQHVDRPQATRSSSRGQDQ